MVLGKELLELIGKQTMKKSARNGGFHIQEIQSIRKSKHLSKNCKNFMPLFFFVVE